MSNLPNHHEQIIRAHAALIFNVVRAVHNPILRPSLTEVLQVSIENGWGPLVSAINRILDGSREESLFTTLDIEDRIIVGAILRGLQDPSSLPNANSKPDPILAAPGLASMIHACRHGNIHALQLLADMEEQMTRVGGDMGHLGGVMRRLVNSENDPDKLSHGMTSQGKSLLLALLDELAKLDTH